MDQHHHSLNCKKLFDEYDNYARTEYIEKYKEDDPIVMGIKVLYHVNFAMISYNKLKNNSISK
jgi:hypothetical protein